MKKIAIFVFFLSSSLFAQVQVAKNVQIGGGGSTTTYVTGGAGINVTGTGTSIDPFVVSLAPVFTIDSFGCAACGTVELGASIVNPSFTATYSVTPASANITNTESIDSPHNLTAPFTSATLSGTFVHTSVTTTTFTLSATQGTTQTANQSINWQPAIFGGVGTAGATSTVTASGTTAVLSTGDVLPRAQLGAEAVGTVLGPFVTSSQNVYLLLTGGSHTFVDTGTGFPFAFNTPTAVSFVNANGVTVSMYLYQSTNPLFGTYNIRVAS